MGGNFTDFGDLVLLIGDFHVPQRALDLPQCFKDLLSTDKIRHVICTGNVGNTATLDMLRSIAGNVHVVKGDCDFGCDFPEFKVIKIGDQIKVGIIHGHQIIPWGDKEALTMWQRRLDCDILITGHLHKSFTEEINGKYFINPGSATGAYQPFGETGAPSFMLMAVQGGHVVLYVYEERDGKTGVVMLDFQKEGGAAS
eukprot:GHVU01217538.1.p1 GENE.GHVU01217538.1~~GHVU01217538.1.p1  ORF type:complete len:198 (+),score=19.88 GHVU01217538.1:172-765(+)